MSVTVNWMSLQRREDHRRARNCPSSGTARVETDEAIQDTIAKRVTTAASRRRRPSRPALVLPVVIMFLFGILEYGRYVMTLQVLTNAAREGAHYALTHTQPVTIAGIDLRQRDQRRDQHHQQGAGRPAAGRAKPCRSMPSDSVGTNIGIVEQRAGRRIGVRADHRATTGCCWAACCYLPTNIPVVAQSRHAQREQLEQTTESSPVPGGATHEKHHAISRRASALDGVVLLLILVSLITLLTFVALAIDLGMLAVARTQCQDAADAAAMAGTPGAQRRDARTTTTTRPPRPRP